MKFRIVHSMSVAPQAVTEFYDPNKAINFFLTTDLSKVNQARFEYWSEDHSMWRLGINRYLLPTGVSMSYDDVGVRLLTDFAITQIGKSL